MAETCRVYWTSHGCKLPRGHDPETEPHICECCDCPDHAANQGRRIDGPDDEYPGEEWFCVGAPPYYGPNLVTTFYGEDA